MQALPVRVSERIGASPVIVGDKRQPFLRTVQNLPSEPVVAIEPVVRLPSVDDPWFDLQLVGGKPLDSHSIEKPWRVGRHK
jgi:hypothetical protein